MLSTNVERRLNKERDRSDGVGYFLGESVDLISFSWIRVDYHLIRYCYASPEFILQISWSFMSQVNKLTSKKRDERLLASTASQVISRSMPFDPPVTINRQWTIDESLPLSC